MHSLRAQREISTLLHLPHGAHDNKIEDLFTRAQTCRHPYESDETLLNPCILLRWSETADEKVSESVYGQRDAGYPR